MTFVIAEKTLEVEVICPECGQTRNIKRRYIDRYKKRAKEGKPFRCIECYRRYLASLNKRGAESLNWKGGKRMHEGYVQIYVPEEDFFYSMRPKNGRSRGGYIPEHRLVMAKHIGRCLHRWEQVHHINGKTTDNRIENLLLRDTNTHTKKYGDAYSQGYEDGYSKGYDDGRSNR